jgi:hypothetical protein
MCPAHEGEHGIPWKVERFVEIGILVVVGEDFGIKYIIEYVIRVGIVGEDKDDSRGEDESPGLAASELSFAGCPEKNEIERVKDEKERDIYTC